MNDVIPECVQIARLETRVENLEEQDKSLKEMLQRIDSKIDAILFATIAGLVGVIGWLASHLPI